MERECDVMRGLLRRILAERFMFNVEDDGAGELGIDVGYLPINADEVAVIRSVIDQGEA